MKRTFAVVLAVAVLVGVAGCAPGQKAPTAIQPKRFASPWPMAGHDARHSAYSDVSGPSTPTAKWVYDTGESRLWPSSPAIAADGTIYISFGDGSLHAVNPDGTRKWQLKLGTGMASGSAPAIGADGCVYVCSSESRLYAVNPGGTKRWGYAIAGPITSSPTIGPDGTIYVGAESGLHAVNSVGSRKWVFAAGGRVQSPAVVGPSGDIYVGTRGGLHALDSSGKKRWLFAGAGPVWHSPAVATDGTVYVGGDGDGGIGAIGAAVCALDASGTAKWRFPVPDGVCSDLALGNGDMVVFDAWKPGSPEGWDRELVLRALGSNGKKLWEMSHSEMAPGVAVGGDGTIYLVAEGVRAIAPDGRTKWRCDLSYRFGPIAARQGAAPALGRDGTLYFATFINDRRASLFAFGEDKGAVR
jgi:outer membrane protein assembly factor BamB